MPANSRNGNNNGNENSQNNGRNQGSSIPGDILGQLAANTATTKDTYLLEKAMSVSLNKIEKHNYVTNTLLADIRKSVDHSDKTLSSVDTTLNKINKRLDSIAQSLQHNTSLHPTSNSTVSTVKIEDQLSDIIDLLRNPPTSAAAAGPTGPVGPTPTNGAMGADALDDVNNTLLDILATAQDSRDLLNSIAQSLQSIQPTSNNTVSTVKIEDQLSDIIDLLLNIPTFDTTVSTVKIEDQLADIIDLLLNLPAPNSTVSTVKIEDQLSDIIDLLLNIPTSDSTVSTVKIEDQLSDIIDLLLNLPTMLAAGPTGPGGPSGPTPSDSAMGADTLDDLNDTLLQILDVAIESRDLLDDISTDTAVMSAMIYNEFHDRSSRRTSDRRRDTGDADNDADEDNKEKSLVDKLKTAISTVTAGGKEGESLTGRLYTEAGSIAGDVVGTVVGTAVTGLLGGIPIVGELIGSMVDNAISGSMKALGELITYITELSRKNRDEIMKAGFEKISKDVKAMATYSIDIYEKATDKIYNAWDQNLSQVTATQGYTKEALNTLQDAVAQRLQAEGYGNVINAADYITQLTNTLNAKIGGDLAEAFAAQNLILQKAVPEVDLSSMAVDFAAIYTNAIKQGGSGEDAMISAMNQIVGATKALEETTNGNNQFITQIGTFLKKAEEVVIRSGGTTDQIAALTTQMMAAEAPLSALVPQLSGFTSDLVDKLMSGNDSTALALRAIMNSIDSSIGVSATSFMESFMKDTQGTLATAYRAIDEFITNNANADAQQEFYKAMESMFGITASQLAQIDFGEISTAISNATTEANMAALTDAENLLKSGETTTYEEQLVANTTNQLLATNSIADTLDNALMRKLEKNELAMERAVYELEAEQSVNLAQHTLAYFTKVFDVLGALLDPLGIFKGLTGLADAGTSYALDKDMYVTTMTMNRIGSTVADAAYADRQTQANAWSTAVALETQSMKDTVKQATALLTATTPIAQLVDILSDTNNNYGMGVDALRKVVEDKGTTTTLNTLIENQQAAAETATKDASAMRAAIEQQNSTGNTDNTSQDYITALENQARTTQEYQDKLNKVNETSEAYEIRRQEALAAQRAQYIQEAAFTQDNHDNLAAIKMSIDSLNTMSNDVAAILQENKQQNSSLDEIKGFMNDVIEAIKHIGSTNGPRTPEFQSTISYNEATRITKNGYMSPSIFSMS